MSGGYSARSTDLHDKGADLCERTCSSVSWSKAGLPRCVDGASVEPSLDCTRDSSSSVSLEATPGRSIGMRSALT
jgi:hypothetical protein